jgi:hypothetical protein
MSRLRAALLIAFFFVLTTNPAVAELFDGLPEEIVPHYPEQKRFVRFAPVVGIRAPMLSRLVIDGFGKKFTLDDVFEDEFFALLPPKKRIRATTDANGLEVWAYPPNTKVVHRIWLRTEPRRIFELRIIWQRPDGTWAYGLYSPDRGGSEKRLKLLRETAIPVELSDTVHGSNASGPVKVTGGRINPNACQACHFQTSPAKYQYPTRESTGPCGLVPVNPAMRDWAVSYRRKHGYWPITSSK